MYYARALSVHSTVWQQIVLINTELKAFLFSRSCLWLLRFLLLFTLIPLSLAPVVSPSSWILLLLNFFMHVSYFCWFCFVFFFKFWFSHSAVFTFCFFCSFHYLLFLTCDVLVMFSAISYFFSCDFILPLFLFRHFPVGVYIFLLVFTFSCWCLHFPVGFYIFLLVFTFSCWFYIFLLVFTFSCWFLHFPVGFYIFLLVFTFSCWFYIFLLVFTFSCWFLHFPVGVYIFLLVFTFSY